MPDNTCVCCGKIIPEGRHICLSCGSYYDMQTFDKPVRTNGDRIRAMSDDEELLSVIGTGCYRCIYRDGECDSGYGEGCIAGNLEWLKQEVQT